MEQEISTDTADTVIAHIEFILDGSIARSQKILQSLGVNEGEEHNKTETNLIEVKRNESHSW
jgi:hypothetical protein